MGAPRDLQAMNRLPQSARGMVRWLRAIMWRSPVRAKPPDSGETILRPGIKNRQVQGKAEYHDQPLDERT
ncbi:hypothetical protein NITHO_730011 [Nitrolancea hollandica Lb]|uniref:Uncharacterized protein n=1 Tax=Nitrolancea hollandica Lb TaxID=1129897 RepID=I4EN43_9BACT|nr:hypothetical protein NITHO_730011 [Nitrolancea hollandica Lb]